ncbi:DNA-binding SARP family transcriptional activator [Rubrivivax gelatinosus]|uniref:AAA family ATPase n=2 Tax=Rubrivivax gelatinosus TaxID=28068 RepID=UPI0018CB1A47|nr:AAA family ATPase [Rubrivivax gelatinosus]MBG6080911.1 DNA-binding SARP family transcriptional activator [Rubrivivax gelatinosus]
MAEPVALPRRWQLLLSGAPRLREAAPEGRTLALIAPDAAWLALAAAPEGRDSRQVALLVWPDAGERGALNNLHQRVHRLRKASGARLVETGARFALAADLELPAEDFGALAADPEAVPGEWLAGCDFSARPALADWLDRQREARRAAWREALAAHAAAAEHGGALVLALRCAERLLALEPLSEHAHRRLMRLHHLRGDRAGAVAAFERCERLLKDELGLRPDAETRALLATVERGRGGEVAPVRPVPAALLRPPRLAGRREALAQLAAAERDGTVVLLVGDAGIGKTRLLQEHLAGRADALHVQARPGDEGLPYATLMRLLQRLDAAEAEAAPARPERLPALLRHCLAAAQRQGLSVVAVDDLHFADRASIETLLTLAGEAALHWILARRPPPHGADDPLAALIESGSTRRLLLGPLEAGELAELLQGLDLAPAQAQALAGQLLQRCGGNPLFVLETLRAAWRDGLPEGTLPVPRALAHLVELRLARLSPDALALARVAAIAAPDFDLPLAEQVLGAPALRLAGAWHELEQSQVLRGEQFAHDLIQDAVLAAIPQVIARHTHRQVAAALAGRGVAPGRVARHWRDAGEHRAAAAAFAAAAQDARAACRPREEGELLEACAQAHEAAGDDEAALQTRIRRVGALLPSAGVGAAIDEAQALVQASRGRPSAALALTALAMALFWGGRQDEAEQAAREALAAPDASEEVQVRASSLLSNIEAMRGHAEAALALMQRWRTRITELADPVLRCEFHGNLATLLIRVNRSGEALPVAEQHLALARATRSATEQLAALMNLSNLHARRGDLTRAVEHGREADRLATEIELTATLAWWNRASLGFFLGGLGRYAEALQLLEAAAGALATSPLQQNLALGLLARVWLTLGQGARAHRCVQGLSEAPPGALRTAQLVLRAAVAAATGQPAAPLWQEAAATGVAEDPHRIQAEIELACEAGRLDLLHELERRADAAALFPQAAEVATRTLALLADRQAAAAAAAAEHRTLQARSAHYYLPALLLRCAEAYERGGRGDAAQRCLATALDWVHRDALPHVPAPFVEGFLHRQPVNVALRAAAARRALPVTRG